MAIDLNNMKPALIDAGLNEELNTLIGCCYTGNRLWDRALSILQVKFVMENTVKYLHTGFSHLYPLLGDQIYDYQASRNNLSTYPVTPAGDKDYDTLQSLFDDLYAYHIDFEKQIANVIRDAGTISDYMTEKFLKDFLLNFSRYTAQTMTLCDRAHMYGDDYMGFDRDIKKFYIMDNKV